MKIEIAPKEKTKFDKLSCGDCFMHENKIYMKTNEASEDGMTQYPINLETGSLELFAGDDVIFCKNAKVIISE